MDSKRNALKPLFMCVPAWLAGVTMLLLSYGDARADFHENEIVELMAGLNGNTNVQFVEIHMLSSIQNCQGTGHHPFSNELPDNTNPPCSTTGTGARLVFFNAAGTQTAEFVFTHNTASGFFDRSILIGTQQFADLVGPQPDFIMPPNIVANSGKVCYKDRGAFFGVNSCVSYGNFTGNTEGFGSPAPALSVNGNLSLTRVNHTFNNATDFALVAPSPINNAGDCSVCPIANAQNVVTSEDTPIDITLTGTDPRGLPLTFIITSNPSFFRGSFGATKPPNLTYTPSKNVFGPDSFSFKVNNGVMDSPIATVTINVTAVNDPPVAFDQTLFAVEGRSFFLNLQASDPEGTFPLIFSLNSLPVHGTLSGTPPSLTYKADSGFVGPDSLTFKASDGLLQSNLGTISINVLADHPPVALGQTRTMTENKTLSLFLSGNDSDFDRLAFTIVTPPSDGALTGTPPSVTYTPTADFIGIDSFTFKVNDGEMDSDPATVTINVIANRPPVAFPQSLTTAFNTPVNITLGGSDPDADTLSGPGSFAIDTPPANGSLSGTLPNLAYTPNTGFIGPDAFSFVTNDGKLTSVAATVSLNVRGPCSSTPIAFGETKSGDLSNVDCFAPHRAGTPADLYTFSGAAGQAVRITMTAGFGTFIGLQGTSGTIVATGVSCSGVNGSSCIPFRAASGDVFVLPATGVYTIEATSISATAVGGYTINLTLVPQFVLSVSKQGTGSGTVQSSPSGINCGSDCSEPFLMGRGVNLFASPDNNSLFMGWSGGGCSGTSSNCVVTVNGDTTVTANFVPTVFIAAAAPNGGEVWRIGSTQTIRWGSNGVNGFVNVQLSRDGGATWKTIVKKTSNTGSQNWKTAKPATTRGRVRICSVTSPSVCGTSAKDFTIQ